MKAQMYIKPEIEIIELETEGVMADSTGKSTDLSGTDNATGGAAYSKRKSFWDNND